MAFDDAAPRDVPELSRDGAICATATCLCIPVLHAQDVTTPADWPADQPVPHAPVEVIVLVEEADPSSSAEFDGLLSCPSGRLRVGDAENDRVIDVPPGDLRVRVTRDPVEFAERVRLDLTPAG